MEDGAMSAAADIDLMKYADLQRLAKTLGVKANQKMDKLKIALKEAVNSTDASAQGQSKTASEQDRQGRSPGERRSPAERKGWSPAERGSPDGLRDEEMSVKGGKSSSGVTEFNGDKSCDGLSERISEVGVGREKREGGRTLIGAGTGRRTALAAVGEETVAETGEVAAVDVAVRETAVTVTFEKKPVNRRKTVAVTDEKIAVEAADRETADRETADRETAVEKKMANRRKTVTARANVPAAAAAEEAAVEAANAAAREAAVAAAVEKKMVSRRKTVAAARVDRTAALEQLEQKAEMTEDREIVAATAAEAAEHGTVAKPAAVVCIEPRPPLRAASRRSSEVIIGQGQRKRSKELARALEEEEDDDDDEEIVIQPAKRQKRSVPQRGVDDGSLGDGSRAATVVPQEPLSSGRRQATRGVATTGEAGSVPHPVTSESSTAVENKNKGGRTQIPRFQSDHLTKKPKLINADYWAKVHGKNFEKMDSLDDWMRKKQQRHADLLSPAPPQSSSSKHVQDKLSHQPQPSRVAVKPTVKVFAPSVLSVNKMNLNFSQSTVVTSTLEKPKLTAESRHGMSTFKFGNHEASAQKPSAAGNSSTSRRSIGLMSPSGGDAEKKLKFDLKASLARPITWQAHRGTLKPYEVDEKVPGGIKAVKVKTREERRMEAEKLRQERRSKVKANHRNLSANISSISNVSMQ